MIFPDKIFDAVIKERVVFQDAIGEGKGVVDYLPSNPDAKREVLKLTKELIKFIK
jgi:cellulose biosynthesis protein BcsQ